MASLLGLTSSCREKSGESGVAAIVFMIPIEEGLNVDPKSMDRSLTTILAG